jgi:hypothetical protein
MRVRRLKAMASKKTTKRTRVLKGQEAFFFHKPDVKKKLGASAKTKSKKSSARANRPRGKKAKMNAALGEYLKAKGMYNAESNADPEWRVRAARAIIKVAKEKELFSTDDVWKTGLDKPREPRALGPEIASAQAAGIIEATNIYELTAQASRHRAPVRYWKSLIFKGPR